LDQDVSFIRTGFRLNSFPAVSSGPGLIEEGENYHFMIISEHAAEKTGDTEEKF
jgi:hypothetical protein